MEPILSLVINQNLEDCETLLWSGQPKHRIVFRLNYLYAIIIILFPIVLNKKVLFFAYQTGDLSGLEWYILSVIILLIFIIFDFSIFTPLRNKHTYYGLTENRIIIKKGVFQSKIISIFISEILLIELKEYLRSNGSITIETGISNKDWNSKIPWWQKRYRNYSLLHIENAQDVYMKIKALQTALKKGTDEILM